MHFHTVLFQFDDTTTPEVVDEVLEGFRTLADVPAVREIVVGPNAMPATDGWSHGMTLVFDSHTTMLADFAPHPLHVAVLESQLPLVSRYLAMDPVSEPSVATSMRAALASGAGR